VILNKILPKYRTWLALTGEPPQELEMSKDEIFDKLKNILVNEFELDAGDVTPDALLGDDLDSDSIDSIDLIVKMKEFMPADKGNVDPSIFKSVKTVQDVVDALVPYMN
jgi:acyl carrier protein